jgi:hypothetical protein
LLLLQHLFHSIDFVPQMDVGVLTWRGRHAKSAVHEGMPHSNHSQECLRKSLVTAPLAGCQETFNEQHGVIMNHDAPQVGNKPLSLMPVKQERRRSKAKTIEIRS